MKGLLHYKLFAANFSIFLVFLPFTILAQGFLNRQVDLRPPNIASFERYGNTALNYSTGSVNPIIPLINLQVDDNLTINIKVEYNNNGLKPDEIPSWVGNGWNLMVGGYISQTSKGLNDFGTNGMYLPSIRGLLDRYLLGQMDEPEAYYYLHKVVDEGWYDTQPDAFTLNLLGESIPFFFKGTQIILVKHKNYKITFENGNFTVIDDKGYSYLFEDKITSAGSYYDEPTTSPDAYNAIGQHWYLTKIMTPAGIDVAFEYQPDINYTLRTVRNIYQMGSDGNCGLRSKSPYLTTTDVTVSQLAIKRIIWKNRVLTFTTSPRQDINGGAALTRIQLVNEQGQAIDDVEFIYNNGNRLELSQVLINDPKTKNAVKKYAFEYYSSMQPGVPIKATDVPLITSSNRCYSLDHWGFYNARNGTQDGIPRLDYSTFVPIYTNNSVGVFGTDDKSADGAASQTGMLRRIYYPTGGYTEFEYEPNVVFYSNRDAVPVFLKPEADRALAYTVIAQASANCPQGPNSGGVSGGGFTITPERTNVQITYNLRSTNNEADAAIKLVDKNGNLMFNKLSSNDQGVVQLTLPAGTYSVYLDAGCYAAMDANVQANQASCSIAVGLAGPIPIVVGGNRVKQITDVNRLNNSNTIRQIKYNKENLLQVPIYFTGRRRPKYCDFAGSVGDCNETIYLTGLNQNAWDGYHVEYNSVTEVIGRKAVSGLNIYSYSGGQALSSSFAQEPYVSAQNLAWRNGLLNRVEHYRKEGPNYKLVNKIDYQYSLSPSDLRQVIPVTQMGVVFYKVADARIEHQCGTNNNPSFPPDGYNGENYKQAYTAWTTDRFALTKEIQTDYSANGLPFTKETIYEYSPTLFQLNKTTTANSAGDIKSTYLWYPNDYNSNVPGANIQELLNGNVVGIQMKTITTSNNQVITGRVNKLDAHGNTTEIAQLETISLQPLLPHDATKLYPNNFQIKVRESYSSADQLQQQTLTNGTPTTYLWGYNHTYLIAKIENATFKEVQAILGQPLIDQLSEATPADDNVVQQRLSPLRVQLTKALITTYTHRPLVGMTSQVDPTGRKVTYEYDGLGRLVRTCDEKGHILSQQQYHYAGK